MRGPSSEPSPEPPAPATTTPATTTPARADGPGAGVVVAATVGAIASIGLLFLAFGDPLAATLDRVLPIRQAPPPATVVEPVATVPTRAPVAEPEPVLWTLGDLESTVEDLALRAEALIAEARPELEQLDDPRRADDARRERVLRRWALWTRTWRNRLEDLETEMPTEDGCAVHASMRPACAALRDVFVVLASVPEPLASQGALERLDAAAARLDALLRPPPPSDEPLDDALDDALDDEAS